MPERLTESQLDTLFRTARSYNSWSNEPVSDADLMAIYELARMGPTAVNSGPARFIFCRSEQARERLSACVSDANKPKVLTSPVTVIVGMDLAFSDRLPELFPHNPGAKNWFNDEGAARESAFRNSTLQGAYLMMAARALGFDCGPMSGFDNKAVDAAFFEDTRIESNFICVIGRGTNEKLFDRLPRLSFEDAAKIL